MTLIKSLLLGSAAGIVAVASAQAADLPTKKAAPVEYVKVCNVGGVTGWTLPGSDTCVKFSGYLTARDHRLDVAGLRHLREDQRLYDRALHWRQSLESVQFRLGADIAARQRDQSVRAVPSVSGADG